MHLRHEQAADEMARDKEHFDFEKSVIRCIVKLVSFNL